LESRKLVWGGGKGRRKEYREENRLKGEEKFGWREDCRGREKWNRDKLRLEGKGKMEQG